MATRTFTGESSLAEGRLGLALSDALTPSGPVVSPSFFSGFAAHPQVLARGLLVLADITATRYFNYTPVSERDPVLTAHGDRLRAECFSACNSVYARLDLLASGVDGGEIGHGTTNVDIGFPMRSSLATVGRDALLHLDVGLEGLAVSGPEATRQERPVEMPDRWVRALGNVAELHHGLTSAGMVRGAAVKRFVASLPPATGSGRSGWLSVAKGEVRVTSRSVPGSVYVSGLHRLSAIKRLLTNVQAMAVYGPEDRSAGPAVVEFDLPGARLTIGLTDEAWRGYSGEGALLSSLATPDVLEDADLVSALLAFEPVIDVPRLAREAALAPEAVRAALAVLAVSGRVGWDLRDDAWFHRELPDDPGRVEKDNPRLAGARALVAAGAVRPGEPGEWIVSSRNSAGVTDYVVRQDPDRCTCTWYLKHADGRGPCKHVLAVALIRSGD